MKVVTYQEKITSDNVERIINTYDLIVECSDNFETKYLINDVCFKLGKTLCFAAVMRMDGQATTFKTQLGGPWISSTTCST